MGVKMGRFTLSVEALPESHWDLLIALIDVIETALLEPMPHLEDAYIVLRRHFTRDTGMSDIVPDFVEDSADLAALTRYLARTGLSVDEQINHVHEAFEPLTDYMELVFPSAIYAVRSNLLARQAERNSICSPVADPPTRGGTASDFT